MFTKLSFVCSAANLLLGSPSPRTTECLEGVYRFVQSIHGIKLHTIRTYIEYHTDLQLFGSLSVRFFDNGHVGRRFHVTSWARLRRALPPLIVIEGVLDVRCPAVSFTLARSPTNRLC